MFQGKRTVLVAYGTRAEAIKLAPVVRELHDSPWLHPVVAVAARGSHDWHGEVDELFSVSTDAVVEVDDTHAAPARLISRLFRGYGDLLAAREFEAAVVQGDTVTALAVALAAFYAKLPVVHVEAGLRTGYRHSPYPEEGQRRVITQLATLHLAPTWVNRENLHAEGVDPSDVVVIGNTVVDAVSHAVARRATSGDTTVEDALADGRPILLVTARRREPPDAGLVTVGRAVASIARARPELLVLLVAADDDVRDRLVPPLDGLANVRVIEPMPYAAFAYLLSRSTVVLTDSGAIQEEAPTFGVPVLVTRDTTERPEAVDAGVARLVGTYAGTIVNTVSRILDDSGRHDAMTAVENPFGDGRAAPRVRAAIEHLLGVGRRLPEFGTSALDVQRDRLR